MYTKKETGGWDRNAYLSARRGLVVGASHRGVHGVRLILLEIIPARFNGAGVNAHAVICSTMLPGSLVSLPPLSHPAPRQHPLTHISPLHHSNQAQSECAANTSQEWCQRSDVLTQLHQLSHPNLQCCKVSQTSKFIHTNDKNSIKWSRSVNYLAKKKKEIMGTFFRITCGTQMDQVS